jgi:hypothetical protein
MKIEEVGKAIKDFLKEVLDKDSKVIKIEKSQEGWIGKLRFLKRVHLLSLWVFPLEFRIEIFMRLN